MGWLACSLCRGGWADHTGRPALPGIAQPVNEPRLWGSAGRAGERLGVVRCAAWWPRHSLPLPYVLRRRRWPRRSVRGLADRRDPTAQGVSRAGARAACARGRFRAAAAAAGAGGAVGRGDGVGVQVHGAGSCQQPAVNRGGRIGGDGRRGHDRSDESCPCPQRCRGADLPEHVARLRAVDEPTLVFEPVISVEPIWKMNTALGLPFASSVTLPEESSNELLALRTPGRKT